MAPRRRDTRAARDLSDRLLADDVVVSPREIERWQQEYGLIEPTDRREKRRWTPQGGSESSYGPGAELQAKHVRALLDLGLDLADAVVVQFVRGHYVETRHLKRILIAKIRERFGPPHKAANWTQVKPVADAQAEQTATRLARDRGARTLRRALHQAGRRPGERINESVKRLFSSMYLIYHAGEPHTRRELGSILAATGLPPEFRDANAMSSYLRAIQQSNLEDVVSRATRAELDQAVSDSKRFLSFAKTVGVDLVDEVAEHERVVQVVGILAMRQQLGAEFEVMMTNLAAAARSRMDQLCVERFVKENPSYSFVFEPDVRERVQALTEEEREIMDRVIAGFLAHHPECAALMSNGE